MINQRKLHISRHNASFIGDFGRTTLHRHGAPVLLIGLSGKISVEIDGNKELCNSVLIDANVPHIVDCRGETVATIYSELDSGASRRLRKQYLSSQAYSFDLLASQVQKKGSEGHILAGNFDYVLGRSLGNEAYPVDPRVEACLHLLRIDPQNQLTQTNVAQTLNLSASRLTHLFKAQMGLSFRRYRLWAQLGYFTRDYLTTKDMTQSALNSGFFDQAHLSNTYKKVFGITPSMALTDLDEFQLG